MIFVGLNNGANQSTSVAPMKNMMYSTPSENTVRITDMIRIITMHAAHHTLSERVNRNRASLILGSIWGIG